MRKNHHNPNKVPPFKPDPEHWTKKVHSWKAKLVISLKLKIRRNSL